MGKDVRVTIIVGGGQAGARAAKALRTAGYTGAIRIYGAETHLPYERPILSKAMLQNEATEIPFVFSAQAYDELEIDVITGMGVAAIDREAKLLRLADGSEAAYDMLLLATGSRLRPLAINGFSDRNILALRTLDDCRAISRRAGRDTKVAVVGGGFIGLEVAATLAARGCHVSVIEMADRLLPRLGCPEASAMVLDHHRRSGIDVRLGASLVESDGRSLFLADGDKIEADLVLAGVGVVPETSLAEAAGLDVRDGILVDEYGRTSDPSIFAAGDATRHYNPRYGDHIRLESWQNANLQAEAAGRAMAGDPIAYDDVPWLWSDQGSLNLQMAGHPAGVDTTVVRGDPGSEEGIALFQFAGTHLVGGVTVNRGKEMPLIRRMLAEGFATGRPESLADTSVPLRKILSSKVTV